jgi:hypothetical protein
MVTSESSAIADSADEQHIPPEPRAARFGEFRVIRRGPVNVSVRLNRSVVSICLRVGCPNIDNTSTTPDFPLLGVLHSCTDRP